MPNILATLALVAWPLLTLILFQRLSASRAMILSLVMGYLFLPEPPAGFDFPLLPALDKHNLPAFSALVALFWTRGAPQPLLPESALARLLLLVFVFSPIFTVMGNAEPLTFAASMIPGLGLKDMITLPIGQALILVPFLLARRLLASEAAQIELLRTLVIGGMVYSLLMLVEIRLSPQLNNWIYGFYQHSFGQTVRFGGYRPMVFLYHGLWTAFFCLMALSAAAALFRIGAPERRPAYAIAALWLGGVLLLAKSLGALVLGAALVPLILIFGPVIQINVALVVAVLALGYPMMKGVGLVPEETILARAEAIDPDRAQSIGFRFDQEAQLLDRADYKPLFGWGTWGRNHRHDAYTGEIETVADGRWIITIGVYGWVGFLAEFGLLALPILLLWRETAMRGDGAAARCIAPLTLILAFNLFDMLPNATLTPLTWMIAGALTGYAEKLRADRGTARSGHPTLSWKPIL